MRPQDILARPAGALLRRARGALHLRQLPLQAGGRGRRVHLRLPGGGQRLQLAQRRVSIVSV